MIVATILTVLQRQTSGGSVTSSGRVLTSTLCRQTTLLRFCHLDHKLGALYFKSLTSTLDPKSIILLLVFTFSVPQTCSGHGRAFSGRCRCDRNYYGDVCQHQVRTWSTCFRKIPPLTLIAGRVLKRRELWGPRTLLGHRSNVLPTKAVLLRGRLLWAWLQQEEPQQGQEAAGGLVHQAGPQREADPLLEDPEGSERGRDGAEAERNFMGSGWLAT